MDCIHTAAYVPVSYTHLDVYKRQVLEQVYRQDGPAVCEWPQDPDQVIEPRVMNRKSEDGCIVSTMIDDLAPFLPREEYEAMRFENWSRKGEKP